MPLFVIYLNYEIQKDKCSQKKAFFDE